MGWTGQTSETGAPETTSAARTEPDPACRLLLPASRMVALSLMSFPTLPATHSAEGSIWLASMDRGLALAKEGKPEGVLDHGEVIP